MKQHFRDWWWLTATVTTINGELHTNCDRELVRVCEAIGATARCYWPMDLVRPFVRRHWCVTGAFL